MKSILSIAILATAICASAADQYLYWMISDRSTLTAADGTKTDLTGSYYAKVKMNGGDYLHFYDAPGGSLLDGENDYYLRVGDITDSVATFAGVINGSPSSFIIELYNDTGTAPGSWVGEATLAWNADYITTSSVMAYASPGVVSQFSAVPEPTSGMLLLLGVAGLALRRKNKKA